MYLVRQLTKGVTLQYFSGVALLLVLVAKHLQDYLLLNIVYQLVGLDDSHIKDSYGNNLTKSLSHEEIYTLQKTVSMCFEIPNITILLLY